jgi:site-specific DNA-methyltransferase (adenine-specific)
MTRIETIGDCTLYLGDCLEILPTLGKVDAVVTDPPYDEFTHRGALVKSEKYGEFGVEFAALSNLRFVSGLLAMTNDWALFFCGLEMLGKYQAEAPDKYVRGAFWDRISNAPQISGDRPAQGGEGIAIFHGRRKNMKWNGGGRAGLFRHLVERGNKEHPTQKPLSLFLELLSLFSYPEQTILDPFMGSGTTGVACVNLGRKFIGIEIEPKYFDIACRRIEEAYKQPRLFAEPAPRPVQETML